MDALNFRGPLIDEVYKDVRSGVRCGQCKFCVQSSKVIH